MIVSESIAGSYVPDMTERYPEGMYDQYEEENFVMI